MGLKRACGAFLSPLRWSAERRTTTPVWPGSLHSRIAALTLALLVSLPKELSLHPPPAALQFLAPPRRGTRGEESKYFLICKLWDLPAADPWLWLAGLAVCRKREGVPLPRSGGGREGADASAIPYKHRLAYAASGATSAYVVLTLRYTTGSPPRCGAPSFPHKVLRPCGAPVAAVPGGRSGASGF